MGESADKASEVPSCPMVIGVITVAVEGRGAGCEVALALVTIRREIANGILGRYSEKVDDEALGIRDYGVLGSEMAGWGGVVLVDRGEG